MRTYGIYRAGLITPSPFGLMSSPPYADLETSEFQPEPQVEEPPEYPWIQLHHVTDGQDVKEAFSAPARDAPETG